MARIHLVECGLVLCSIGCGSADATAGDDSTKQPSNGAAVFEELGGANYVPLSLSEIVASSEVIALGHMADVRRGLTVVSETSAEEARFETIVILFNPSSVLKGSASKIYLEADVGPALDLNALKAGLPDQELTVFVTSASRTPVDGVTLENEGAGHPAGTALHRLTTPQGLLQEGDNSLVQPLELHGEQLFDETTTSFEELTVDVQAEL